MASNKTPGLSQGGQTASEIPAMEHVSTLDNGISVEAKISIINPIYMAFVSWIGAMITSVGRITFWTSGIMLAITGWLITGNLASTYSSKSFFSMASILIGVLGVAMIISIHRSYADVVQTIKRINHFQNVYTRDYYIKAESLFPPYWSEFDSRPVLRRLFSLQEQPIFRIAYTAIPLISIFCSTVIWFL